MDADTQYGFTKLRADGGAAADDMLMQFQADLLGIPVERPAILETTAQGAAYLAGLASGFWASVEEIAKTRPEGQVFRPQMDPAKARGMYAKWQNAVGTRKGLEQGGSMNRELMISRLREHTTPWDIVVIGGGATGAGVAVDAATRGFDVLLVEREDFGKGTSSRSTKLVHGGVRYLEQGNVSLVMEALKERGLLLHNAPHLVHDLLLVVPTYSWWESPFYGIGLKVYDVLAGKYGFGKSSLLSREETLEHLPTIRQDGLKGGVAYHDGQFDDTRLLTHLMATAIDHGATVLNYTAATELLKDPGGFVNGVVVQDRESGERFNVSAKVVVNASGIFADEVRRLAQPDVESHGQSQPGNPPCFRQVFSARRHGHHGPPYYRRKAHVCPSMARAHDSRYHGYSHPGAIL